MNSVKSDKLDISVDENDAFDPEKSRLGKNRWLYFRYTLEIDPIEGVSPRDYVAAVGTLLQSLWSSCLDAVASCDFEEQLPRNVRRFKWSRIPRPDLVDAGGTAPIDVREVVIPATGDLAALDECVRIVRHYWTDAQFQNAASGEKYPSYADLSFASVHELFVYKNAEAEAAWDSDSPDSPLNSMLHLVLFPDSVTALLDDPTASDVRPMLEAIRASFADNSATGRTMADRLVEK